MIPFIREQENLKGGKQDSGFQRLYGGRSSCLLKSNTRKFGSQWYSVCKYGGGYMDLYICQNPYSSSPKRMTFTILVFFFVFLNCQIVGKGGWIPGHDRLKDEFKLVQMNHMTSLRGRGKKVDDLSNLGK